MRDDEPRSLGDRQAGLGGFRGQPGAVLAQGQGERGRVEALLDEFPQLH